MTYDEDEETIPIYFIEWDIEDLLKLKSLLIKNGQYGGAARVREYEKYLKKIKEISK